VTPSGWNEPAERRLQKNAARGHAIAQDAATDRAAARMDRSSVLMNDGRRLGVWMIAGPVPTSENMGALDEMKQSRLARRPEEESREDEIAGESGAIDSPHSSLVHRIHARQRLTAP